MSQAAAQSLRWDSDSVTNDHIAGNSGGGFVVDGVKLTRNKVATGNIAVHT